MIATNAGGALATKAAVKFLTRKIPGLGAVLTAEDMAKAFNSAENVEEFHLYCLYYKYLLWKLIF